MTIASLVVDIAANVLQLEKDVKKVDDSLGKISTMAANAGKALAAAFTVTAIIGAVKSFTDLTGQLTDMSAKTGIGTTALQKLKYMAEQSGGSLDQVTAAITKMGVNLVNGDKGAVKAMERLGLSIDDVRRMEPDQAFAAIADKIAGIESPMERAKLATELFGKSGAELLPMMTGNLEAMGAEAEKMGLVLSEDVVKAGDDFGDTLGQLMTAGMAILGKVIGPFLPLLSLLAQHLVQVATIIGNILGPAMEILVAVMLRVRDFVIGLLQKFLDFASKIPGVSAVVAGLKQGFEALRTGATTLHASVVGVEKGTMGAASGMAKLRYELPPTTAATKATAAATKELAREAAALVKRGEEQEAMHFKNQIALQKQTLALQEAIAKKRQLAELLVTTMPMMVNWSARIDENRAKLSALADVVGGQLAQQQEKGRAVIEQARIALEEQKERAGQLGNALLELGNVVGSQFISSMGGIFNAVENTKLSFKNLKSGIGELTSGGGLTSILSGFTSIVGGIGGIVSAAQAAIQIGKALFSVFDRDKGRDLVEDFVKQFGGFEGIQKIFAQMGDEGHRLWVMLTQGVGRNNPDQARAAIEEVTKAIEKFRSQVDQIPTRVDVDINVNRHDNGGGGGGEEGGFARGTPSLDYVDFGQATPTTLHGDEAVIPRGRAGELATQIASALADVMGGMMGDTLVYVGNDQLDARQVRVARRAAATGRLRPRVAHGRSF